MVDVGGVVCRSGVVSLQGYGGKFIENVGVTAEISCKRLGFL